MIFNERYPLKRCQGCVKLIASKVNCFLNINDLSEVQLCNYACPPLIFLSSVHTCIFFSADTQKDQRIEFLQLIQAMLSPQKSQ